MANGRVCADGEQRYNKPLVPLAAAVIAERGGVRYSKRILLIYLNQLSGSASSTRVWYVKHNFIKRLLLIHCECAPARSAMYKLIKKAPLHVSDCLFWRLCTPTHSRPLRTAYVRGVGVACENRCDWLWFWHALIILPFSPWRKAWPAIEWKSSSMINMIMIEWGQSTLNPNHISRSAFVVPRYRCPSTRFGEGRVGHSGDFSMFDEVRKNIDVV